MIHLSTKLTWTRWTSGAALAAIALLMVGPANAQTTPESSQTTPTPSTPAKIPLVFRGISGSDTLRLGATGSDSPPGVAVSGGAAQTDLDAAQAYDLQWGDPAAPERLKFYVPRPAEGGAPSVPIEITLRHGMRGVPDETWSYPWAPGENQKLAEYAPPPAAPAPAPRPETRRHTAPEPDRQAQPVASAAPNLEPRVAALESAIASQRPADEGSGQPAIVIAVCSLALAAAALIAGFSFFFGVWRPHQAAMAQALQRSLPDALRSQSQEVAALTRRLETAQRQWEQERDAIRRGQELLASHAMPRPGAVDETERLRREVEELRRMVHALRATSGASSAAPSPEPPGV